MFFYIFQERMQARGCLRASHAQGGSKPFRYPPHELGSTAFVGGGFRCSCANPRASCVETAT